MDTNFRGAVLAPTRVMTLQNLHVSPQRRTLPEPSHIAASPQKCHNLSVFLRAVPGSVGYWPPFGLP